jgi:hypothetical protein
VLLVAEVAVAEITKVVMLQLVVLEVAVLVEQVHTIMELMEQLILAVVQVVLVEILRQV